MYVYVSAVCPSVTLSMIAVYCVTYVGVCGGRVSKIQGMK